MRLDARTARAFVRAMTAECERNAQHLRISGYPRPYFLSYLLRETRTVDVWGRLGNLNHVSDQLSRHVYCDCRVGSYRFDQVQEGGLDDHDSDVESYDHIEMPVGNDLDALKYHLWKLTDVRYREAVTSYLRRRSQNINYVDPNAALPSFRKEAPRRDLAFREFAPVDIDKVKRFITTSSQVIKRYPEIKNSWVEFRLRDTTRLFVNSEGTELIDQARICELSCDLWLLTPQGEGIATRVMHCTPDVDGLPALDFFITQVRERVRLLKALGDAPTIKSYAGPVLLAPGPAGILFHEVLGHRLEGSRLLSTREGQTFKRHLGRQILPSSLSVYDDPTLKTYGGTPLVGHYKYDDEGTAAHRVTLVKNGKLVDFLRSRAPTLRSSDRSNGHARSEHHERPISRMANLIVEVADGLTHEALKAKFIDEIRRQKSRYGILVLDAEGGETATDTYDFQAFMGQISVAIQVWADGRTNLVRGVDFVGTPLSALRNILAVGERLVSDNAFCGAESGVVPVSTTSPAVLMKNLELQASDQRKFAQYVLPMPYEKAAINRRRRRKKRR
ncbi:MAG: TldD/PmbA family protein [Deltaproteobacteria bacterium]|nr:TldD/PmbA family protein [Deltaproteobacteria bacterium]